jgi:hypothetical protein
MCDSNPWHRWFKTERLELVLIHDSSLNKGTRHVMTSSSSASNSVSNSSKSKFKVRSFETQSSLASSDKTTVITTSSSSAGSVSFTFKESLNALLDCLEHWSDVNHSRQLFVKFLRDKSAESSEQSSGEHMSFCVARLSKESDNLMVVYIYFFAATPEHRAAIMHELRHTLEHAHCYGHKAIAVCKKPLRPLLVRYDLNQLRATHAQQHFGGTARPSRVMHRRSSTATTVKIGKLARTGRSSIQLTTPQSEDSVMHTLEEEVSERDGESVPGESESETDHDSTTTEEEDALLNAEDSIASTSQASPSHSLHSSTTEHALQSSAPPTHYDNKTAQLSDLIQLAPVFTLLMHYLAHHRWIWLVNSARTREGIVEAVVRTRLSEGFRIAHCDRGVTLFKEIYLRVSASSEPVPCIVQYVVFVTSTGFIVTELWMEPQRGVVQGQEGELNESDVFRRLKKLIYHVDHELVSSLFTFDRLQQILSKEDDKSAEDEREDDKYLHITKRADVEIVRPVFSVDAVIEMSKRHTEKFAVLKPMFKPEQNDKVMRVTREIRSTLTDVLHSAVAIYSDCTVPGRVEETVAKYFVKGISQKEVLLVSIDDDLALSAATDDETLLTALQHDLTVEFCECSRTALEHTPPTASRAVREWLEHLAQTNSSTATNTAERAPSDDESEAQSTQSTASTRRLLSLGARQFGGAVRAEYRRGLVRTLYSALRDETLSIGSSELDVMQWTARPYPSELDLTQCARLLTKTESAASSEALTHKFSSVFSRYFVPVHEGSGLFYFRPEHAAHTEEDAELTVEDFVVDAPVLEDDTHHLADNSPVPEIEDIWASESRKKTDSPSTPTKSANGALAVPSTTTDLLQAKTKLGSSSVYTVPLFMRLECVLHPAHSHGEGDVVVPVTTIPTPHTVAELQQHAGHKILLRFVLITLPPQQLRKTGLDEERSALSALPSVHEEEGTHSANMYHNEAVSLLPADIRHLLSDLHKSVQALLAEQVLQALRVQSETLQQLQRPTVDIVLHYMTHLAPPVLFNFTVPLLFVEARECRKLFPHELEHSALLPLHRLDDLFLFVHRDEEQRMHVPFWLILSYAGDVVKVRFQWCAELFSDPASPYRRLFELEDSDHKASLRVRVLNALRQRIRLIGKRVNQLFLLYQLHDTKVCSVLLEPEHDDEDAEGTKSKRNSRSPRQSSDQSHESRQLSQLQNQQYTHTLYYPGQFSMPIVHVMALPLNERLQPSTAIKALINSTLHHFQVTNRRHMFVYRQQDGHTFYLRLLSYSGDLREFEHSAYLDSALVTASHDTALHTTPIPIPESGRPRAASSVSSATTSGVNAQQSYLIVKVYGIDPPSSEITEQLHKLLEKKLHAITLSIISTLLGRNPQMKLTPADVNFLRPADRAPQRQYHIALPTHLLADPYLYLLFLKQNLAKQHLHVMHFATPPSHETTLLLHQNNSFGLSCALLNQGPLTALSSPPGTESASPLSPGYDTPNLDSLGCVNTDSDGRCVVRIKEADFSFIYNNIVQTAATTSTAPSLVTSSPLVATATGPPVFGQGVACIALDYAAAEDPDQVHAGPVTDQEWLQLPRLELRADAFTAAESVAPISLLNPHLRLALNVSLWSRGSVEVQALIDHVTECANQALVEYALETYFKVNTVALAASEVPPQFSAQNTPSSSPVPLTTHNVVRTEDESARARARLSMLQQAHSRQVPSVREIRTELTMPAWTVPYYVPEVLDIVRDLAPPLVTAVLFARDDSASFQPLDMSRVKPASAHRTYTYSEQNKQLLFHKDRGTLALIAVKPQSAIYDSVHNQHAHSEETSHSAESEGNEQRYSTQRDLVYYHNVKISPLVTVHRHSFIYLTVQHSRVLQCYTYNINPQIAERLKSQLSRINEWTHLRSQLLSNVLHQKMGLFYHVPRATLEAQSTKSTAAQSSAAPSTGPGLNVQLTNENVELLMANPTPPRKSRGRKVALLRKSRENTAASPTPSAHSTAASNNTNQSSLIIHTTRPAGPVSSSLSRSVAQTSYLANKTAFSRFKQPPHLAGAQPNPPKTGHMPAVPVTPVNTTPVTTVTSLVNVTPVTESSTCPFEILLKYHHPQHVIGAEHDPVLRHTAHARQIVPHLQRLQQRQHTIKQIYNNWGRRNAVRPNDSKETSANKGQHHSLRSQQEVENVIKFSRLVHCCRIPFLLARMPTEHKPTSRSIKGSESAVAEVKDQLVKPIFSTALTPQAELAHWQRGLLDRFLLDYEKYLESYGVHQLNTLGQSATENAAVTSTENIKYPKVYMQRVFRGGLLLVVLGFRDFFVTCDLYFMHSLRTSAAGLYNLYLELETSTLPHASGAKEVSLITQQTELILNPKKLYRQLKMFSDECNKLKDHLHMNSFVYDYHLRQIQHFLLAAPSKAPYPPLELVHMLQSLVRYHHAPPKYARNQILQHSFAIDLQELTVLSPLELFSFVADRAELYGVANLHEHGIKPAIYFSATTPALVPHYMTLTAQLNNDEHPFIYTVIAFVVPPPASDDKKRKQICLDVFIIRTNTNTIFPQLASSVGQVSSLLSNTAALNPAKSSAEPGSAHTTQIMSELATSPGTQLQLNESIMQKALLKAKEQLVEVIQQAVMHSERDIMWNLLFGQQVVGSPSLSGAQQGLTEAQFHSLMRLIYCRHVEELDPQLTELIRTPLPWLDLVPHLTVLYSPRVRQYRVGQLLHLFVLNPEWPELTLHLVFGENSSFLEVFACRKELDLTHRAKKNASETEQISHLINSICHWTWRLLLPRQGANSSMVYKK